MLLKENFIPISNYHFCKWWLRKVSKKSLKSHQKLHDYSNCIKPKVNNSCIYEFKVGWVEGWVESHFFVATKFNILPAFYKSRGWAFILQYYNLSIQEKINVTGRQSGEKAETHMALRWLFLWRELHQCKSFSSFFWSVLIFLCLKKES